MEFGLNFFPDVKPHQKSAQQYFAESLRLAEEGERLGLTHARIVEHYFHYYGGYSPNPIVFLSALSQRTRRMRLITGAVLPVFILAIFIRTSVATQLLDGDAAAAARAGTTPQRPVEDGGWRKWETGCGLSPRCLEAKMRLFFTIMRVFFAMTFMGGVMLARNGGRFED